MHTFTQKMNNIAATATRSPKKNSIPPKRNWAWNARKNRPSACVVTSFVTPA